MAGLTCEQKKLSSPILRHVGHWSLASFSQPNVWHSFITFLMLLFMGICLWNNVAGEWRWYVYKYNNNSGHRCSLFYKSVAKVWFEAKEGSSFSVCGRSKEEMWSVRKVHGAVLRLNFCLSSKINLDLKSFEIIFRISLIISVLIIGQLWQTNQTIGKQHIKLWRSTPTCVLYQNTTMEVSEMWTCLTINASILTSETLPWNDILTVLLRALTSGYCASIIPFKSNLVEFSLFVPSTFHLIINYYYDDDGLSQSGSRDIDMDRNFSLVRLREIWTHAEADRVGLSHCDCCVIYFLSLIIIYHSTHCSLSPGKLLSIVVVNQFNGNLPPCY